MTMPHRLGDILSLYPNHFRALQPSPVELKPGFSDASVLRLKSTEGEFCLRGWPPGEFPRARIVGLHRLLDWIAAHGVSQVSVPISSQQGTTLVFCHDRFWQLEPWKPGEADFWKNPSRIKLQAVMRCLANWHRAAASFVPGAEEATWFACKSSAHSPAIVERLKQIENWDNGRCDRLFDKMQQCETTEFRHIGFELLRLYRQLSAGIASNMQAAARVEFSLQPCLRDCWHDHFLFTGDEVTGLIDPSACRTENVASDLARLLGSLVGDDANEWAAGLDAYHAHRQLTNDEFRLVKILDQSGVLLSGMRWLDRRFLREEIFAQPNRVLNRLRGIQKRLESLASRH